MLELTYIAFLIAVMTWCYHTILKEDLLSPWFSFGYNHFGKYQDTWKEFIYKPIWGCQYCTAGQLGLWSYLYFFWYDYNLFYHIAFITLSIFLTKIIFYARDHFNQA